MPKEKLYQLTIPKLWPTPVNYVQVQCEKHEYIEVTQTTAPDTGSKKWMQCKYCGLILVLPEVNPNSEII